jgi:hypothetical protein
MARLVWNEPGTRIYESGVDRGIISLTAWPRACQVWDGLVSVSREASAGDPEPVYYDGEKVVDVFQYPTYKASVTAISAPTLIDELTGKQQLAPGLFVSGARPSMFNFSYRTLIGNDTVGSDLGYRLHFVYNVLAVPNALTYSTDSDRPTPLQRAWTFHARPWTSLYFPSNHRASAYYSVDSRLADPAKLAIIEDTFWGDAVDDGVFESPEFLLTTLS